MIEFGIYTSEADYWVHLHPREGRVFCFLVSDMRWFVFKLPVTPGKSRNGVITGAGYKVPKLSHIIRGKDVPPKYLENIDWKELTNRQAGRRGEKAVLAMLNDRFIFPTFKRPFTCTTNKIKQFSGIDILNGEISIDVKTETYFPTKNLFVQKGEQGHAVHLRPDGSTYTVELPQLTEDP